MKKSVHGLRNDLEQIQTLLTQGSFLSFSAEEREALLAESQKFLHRLDGLAEGFLTVGLLGGTGVGKSSVMNALAGSKIASTSYRRPHTDRVLIYRHVAAAFPAPIQEAEVPWREITHEADAIRQIILCDMPDFDSLLGEHRDRVLDFLEHLDVLVWVSSPEKYADERFYAFLRQVPKAKQNFYFVLNKADLLFQDEAFEAGYEQLTKVTKRFQQHLNENGIEHPLICSVSAEEAFESAAVAPWNQFDSFRNQIFQHRDIKEVMSIKAANLDVEVQQLLSLLEKEVFNLKTLQQVVQDFIQELEKERAGWARMGQESFNFWLETRFKAQAYAFLSDSSPLVGPAYGLAASIKEWQRWTQTTGNNHNGLVSLSPDDRIAVSLQRQLERVENRMTNRLLRLGLPAPFIKQLEEILNVQREWEDLLRHLQHFLEMRIATQKRPSFRGFRWLQYAVYALFFASLVLALAGNSAWREFFAYPSWTGFGTLVTTMIGHLYGPIGLAALASYVLLHVFFGFVFYGRYKKILQRRTQRFIDSLKLEMQELWEQELNSIITQLRDYDHDLHAQAEAISLLRNRRIQ